MQRRPGRPVVVLVRAYDLTTKGRRAGSYESLGQAPESGVGSGRRSASMCGRRRRCRRRIGMSTSSCRARRTLRRARFHLRLPNSADAGNGSGPFLCGRPGCQPHNTRTRDGWSSRGPDDSDLPSDPGTSPEATSPLRQYRSSQAVGSQLFIFDPTRTISSVRYVGVEDGGPVPYYLAKSPTRGSDAARCTAIPARSSVMVDPFSKP